jgi:hypothetical protein
LLQIAAQAKVPVVATGMAGPVLGEGIGLRSAAVLGILNAAGPEMLDCLRPFATDIRPAQLPFLRVETDVFTVHQ